jgi:pre-mRNA-processing factor SLU7
MTHKRQDCLERPRKKGAKYTNRNIAPDELTQHIEAGYDAKRDRWNGYDPAEHKKIYEEYEAVEAERQRLREEEIDKQTTTDMAAVRKVAKAGKAEGKEGDPDFGSSDEEDADEDKYADAADAVGQKMDTKTRITVRNLRIREDTAKYLINLDPSSAYYDPKTRSMRDNPLLNVPPEEVSCRHFSDRGQGRLHAQRRGLLETTFCAILARRQKCRSYSSLRGNLKLVGMTFI